MNKKEKADQEAPRGLNLEESLEVLRKIAHPEFKRPPEVIAAFAEFFEKAAKERTSVKRTRLETVTDAAENHDKYIYGY